MSAVATHDQFLDLVRKSGILEAKKLDEFLTTARAQGLFPPDAPTLADLFIQQGLLTKFQTKVLLQGKWKGFFFAEKYKVLNLLGAGGSGRVFLCEHQRLKRLVAVKVLPTDRTSSAENVERFYREARAVAALNHPNIVRVFDIDQSDNTHFMVLEYVDGRSLHDVIALKGPLPVDRAANYIAQAAQGLQHAFEQGWVHRDVKPGNILLERTGTIKLLDLGLARLFDDEADNLTVNQDSPALLGTADYISPEQAMSSHAVDIRTDIYSLGATFYYLVCGRPPFPKGSLANKLLWHQVKQPDAVTSVRPDVPPALGAIIERMMAKDPAARYQTPAEVATALEPWAQMGVVAPPEDEMPRGQGSGIPSSDSNWATTTPPATGSPTLITNKKGAGVASLPGSNPLQDGVTPVVTRQRHVVEDTSTSMVGRVVRELEQRKLPVVWIVAGVGGGLMLASMLFALWLSSGTRPNLAQQTNPPAIPTSLPPSITTVTPVPPVLPTVEPTRPITPSNPPANTLPVNPLATRPKDYIPCPNFGGSTAPAPGRSPIIVSLTGRPGSFRSVAQALASASSGDVIRVELPAAAPGQPAPAFEERLKLSKIPSRITIEASDPSGSGQPVEWRPPNGQAFDQPLIEIADAERLRLRGFRLSGRDHLDRVISVSGRCPGLTLEDLQCEGFQGRAISFVGAMGERDEPIVISRVRFVGRVFSKALAAITLAAPAGAVDEEIRIRDCRFEGPFEAALQLTGAIDHVEFLRNRILKVDAVVRYSPEVRPARVRLIANQNTCCEVQYGVFHFDLLPHLEDERNRIVFKDNLFLVTSAFCRVEELGAVPQEKVAELFTTLAGNVADDGSLGEGIPFPAVSRRELEPLPINIREDEEFLRYPPESPLSALGSTGGPVGSPPLK